MIEGNYTPQTPGRAILEELQNRSKKEIWIVPKRMSSFIEKLTNYDRQDSVSPKIIGDRIRRLSLSRTNKIKLFSTYQYLPEITDTVLIF